MFDAFKSDEPEKVDPDAFLKKAKHIVVEHYNSVTPSAGAYRPLLITEDVYIVWFSKTLQNWKALLSTNVSDGLYYELTYNGNKAETYLDVYAKIVNKRILDEDLAKTNF